ncbi:MAG TPA: methionine ABC transporter substrate-binding protein [Sutterella sp.]|nr:methionine ABC transporter substrate-binding protein [Sutterella sp.]
MKRRIWILGAVAAIAASVLSIGCTNDANRAQVLKVGATPAPHAEILKVVAPLLAKDGIELKIIEFTDYVQPNLALADREIDANYFQHAPYLERFTKDRKIKLDRLVDVHVETMGIYSTKHVSLQKVKNGAVVVIPNDKTNALRAMKLLETANFFKLGGDAENPIIVDNPKWIRVEKVDAETLPRVLKEADFAVINANFALSAGLNPTKDALFVEQHSPYVNIVAVRAGDNREILRKLAKAITSPEVKAYILEHYAGAISPAF